LVLRDIIVYLFKYIELQFLYLVKYIEFIVEALENSEGKMRG
jgi:hypothetical protein